LFSEVEYPPWVVAGEKLPLAFAQVREDALLDLAVVETFERPPRVAMVASGGCTAAALAGCGMVESLHLVDPNPAQLTLSRLKLGLLVAAEPRLRFALLGHAPMPVAQRKERLLERLGRLGLDAGQLGLAGDPGAALGELVPVEILEATPHSLLGRPLLKQATSQPYLGSEASGPSGR